MNRTFQCSAEEGHLPFSALCNGTNECANGDDETNIFCESKSTNTEFHYVDVYTHLQTSVFCHTMEDVHIAGGVLHSIMVPAVVIVYLGYMDDIVKVMLTGRALTKHHHTKYIRSFCKWNTTIPYYLVPFIIYTKGMIYTFPTYTTCVQADFPCIASMIHTISLL